MAKKKIYFADLTHTAQGISASTFPLGISFVLSYAKEHLGDKFDYELFKFPEDLAKALSKELPAFLCFSNYSWNSQLAYQFSLLAKQRAPGLITIWGGPNFPTADEEKAIFLKDRPAIDFYIESEGEAAIVELARRLAAADFNVGELKKRGELILNTAYLAGDKLIKGPLQRIKDINSIPSPYLSGTLDAFFNFPLVPMIETTRGCPFTCTFCSDASAIKNSIVRYDSERTRKELRYIAEHVKGIDELIITDLNFAMYKEDILTAKTIAETQKEHGFPVIISASAGKNRPELVKEAAAILDGSWTLGASMQTTDAGVLKAIKRSNISNRVYQELIDFGNTLKNSKTHSEFILGMPDDTKAKHFECLRIGIESNANFIRMFQAMLLVGTEMASQATREKYGLITRFRTIPGSVGIYNIFGEELRIAEIEEIIIGCKDFPVEDYLDCRIMNLFVEAFHNNRIFEEIFAMVRSLGVSNFDCLLYMKEHQELYPPSVKEIIKDFLRQTMEDLFNSSQEAGDYVLAPGITEKYIQGELGINELLVNRARLFSEFDASCNLLFESIKGLLKKKGKLSEKVESYMDELKTFMTMRKKDSLTDTEASPQGSFKYDFEEIRRREYKIDPNNFPILKNPVKLRFFHDPDQKRHVINQSKIYANTPSGLGRLIQRSNLKFFYRSFKKCEQ